MEYARANKNKEIGTGWARTERSKVSAQMSQGPGICALNAGSAYIKDRRKVCGRFLCLFRAPGSSSERQDWPDPNGNWALYGNGRDGLAIGPTVPTVVAVANLGSRML